MDDATKTAIENAMKPLAALVSDDADKVESGLVEAPCMHPVWRRGILAGGRYIKSCWKCGAMQDIDFAEWQTISDR